MIDLENKYLKRLMSIFEESFINSQNEFIALLKYYPSDNIPYLELLNMKTLKPKPVFVNEYLGEDNEGYAIHIKNLHIFDKPKELSEYYSEYYVKGIGFTEVKLRKAPQNMMYCYNVCNQKNILISIQPEWLCKILNGEKTIEVRKKVLKEMLR